MLLSKKFTKLSYTKLKSADGGKESASEILPVVFLFQLSLNQKC